MDNERKKKISTIIRESALSYYNYTIQGGDKESLTIERDFVCTRIVGDIATADIAVEVTIRVNRKDISNIAMPLHFIRGSAHPLKLPTPFFFPAGTEIGIDNFGSASTSSYLSFEGFYVKDIVRQYMTKLFTPFIYLIKDAYTAGASYTASVPLAIVRDADFELTSLVGFVYDTATSTMSNTLTYTTNLDKQNGITMYKDDTRGKIMYGEPDYPHKLILPIVFRGGTSILPKITIASGAYGNNQTIWRFLIGRKV